MFFKVKTFKIIKKTVFCTLGPTGADEMCNLYLMYYSYSKTDDFKICFEEQNPSLSSKLPQGLFFFFRSSFVGAKLPYQWSVGLYFCASFN